MTISVLAQFNPNKILTCALCCSAAGLFYHCPFSICVESVSCLLNGNSPRKNILTFASDFHLGIDVRHSSRERERQIVRWLEQIRPTAEAIYLLGDLFDFWFEYKTVVPRGFVRLMGKLGTLRDEGIPIYAIYRES